MPSLTELQDLVTNRDADSLDRLQSLGGVERLAKSLRSHPVNGLNPDDVINNRKDFGKNSVDAAKPRTYLSFIIDALSDSTVLILCASATVSLILAGTIEKTISSYAEGSAIIVAILVVTNVTAINDWRKQRQFIRLNQMVEDISVRVSRSGSNTTVPIADVVVGDVVILSIGDILCADGILLEGSTVKTDESALTGEPELVRKSETAPFLLSGTKVMDGSGRFLVVAVGPHSEAGRIRVLIQTGRAGKDGESQSGAFEGGESPLTAKLDALAVLIGKFGSVAALCCFVIMFARYAIVTYAQTNAFTHCAEFESTTCSSSTVASFNSGQSWPLCGSSTGTCCDQQGTTAVIRGSPCPFIQTQLSEYLSFFITAITVLVVAVPEGLPLAVTLSLAFSVAKMQKEMNLVKHLDACETMGSATAICSDKTGTLTKNRMCVTAVYVNGQVRRTEAGKKKCSEGIKSEVRPEVQRMLSEGVAVNSTADIKLNPASKLYDHIGNSTDCALLTLTTELGFDYSEIRGKFRETGSIVKLFPFSSARKRSTVICKVGGGFRVYVKGASEMLLALCDKVDEPGNTNSAMTEDARTKINSVIDSFARLAMRTIVLAYRDFATLPQDLEETVSMDKLKSSPLTEILVNPDTPVYSVESGITFLALVGIEDPVRDEVPRAIATCRKAGIDVRMVTGDNIQTATAIAKACNILRPVTDLDANGDPLPNRVLTGPDFRKKVLLSNGSIDQVAMDEVWPKLRVLARSSPTDKYNLVCGMMDSDLYSSDAASALGIYLDKQVVAVTGDGTNDAPVLKKADVGFAMGITGTQVAKDAADIILMDDNFSSIVSACKWGRNVYESIAKFLQFQLTVNIVAVTLAIAGSISSSTSPLKPVQMLWVNLIMDSLGSLALATEPPTDSLLDRPPMGKNRSMFTREMKLNIIGHSTYQLIVLLTLAYAGASLLGIQDGAELTHNSISEHYSIIFNAFVCMQLCNQVNMRNMHHELNPFAGITGNFLFIGILIVEIIGQVIIMFYGGVFFKVVNLNTSQWILCVILGLLEFPVQVLIVLISKMYVCNSKRVGNEKVPDSPAIVVARTSSSAKSLHAVVSGMSAVRGGIRKASDAKLVRQVSSFGQAAMKKNFAQVAVAYRAAQNKD